jgi:uncharacterized membrane protein YfcA
MLNSLWGFFIGLSNVESVPWKMIFLVVVLASLGMALGLRLKNYLRAESMKPAFGVFVLLMGGYVLWRSL